MSINPINRPQTPPAEVQQTSKAGDYNARAVNQSSAQATNDSASLSANIPQSQLHSRTPRRATSGDKKIFNAVRLLFKRQPRRDSTEISSPTISTSVLLEQAKDAAKSQTGILIDVARSGIAAAMSNIVEGLAEEKSSAEVKSFLESGDKGIRRATTAIYNLSDVLSFDHLSAEKKAKMPAESLETLERQSMQIKEMAKDIGAARFRDGTRNFNQLGTTANNGYAEMMKMHPQQDQAMRAWIRNGIHLGSELINAQSQIMLKGKTQSDDYLKDLQDRVNIFAFDMPEPLEIPKMEGFADEVLNEALKESKETQV